MPIPPSSVGYPRVSHDTQWYFFFSFSIPPKKSAMTFLMYFKVVLGGDIAAIVWIDIDCKTSLTKVILLPKFRILDCQPMYKGLVNNPLSPYV